MTTTMAPAANIPRVADLRRNLRQARRAHSERTLGELLTDVYLLLFLAVVYGGSAAVSIKNHLKQPLDAPVGTESTRFWLLLVLLVVAGAFAWRGLRMVGPLITTPPAQAWIVSTPVDRADWLRAPLMVLLVFMGIVGAGVALLVSWAGLTSAFGWALAAGVGAGVGLAAIAVLAQARPHTVHKAHRGPRPSDVVLVLSILAALAIVITSEAEFVLSRLSVPAIVLGGLGVVVAIVASVYAFRSLGRIDRTTLSGGAELAGAAMTAAVMLDVSLVTELIAARRWRHARRVHSRHWLAGGPSWVMFQADVLRQWRRRGDLFAWAALMLAPYVMTVFAPSAVGTTRIIAAYIAVDRLAGGLRLISRSPALRRALGGTNGSLKGVHILVPAIGLAIWWGATLPAGGAPQLPLISGILVAGLLGAVYRTATRKPMSYDDGGGGGSAGSPIGPIPVNLIRQLFRGPDVVLVLALFGFLTANLQ